MQAAQLTHGAIALDDSEAAICAVLRGESVPIADPATFAALAVSEGLAPLILSSSARVLPPACVELLQGEVHRQLALAAVREPELRRLLAAFSGAGIDVLVIKGAHLAYSIYGAPALRPRNDTDLLVRLAHVGKARRTLDALGYRHQPAITGAAVQGQEIFEHDHLPGSVLDVHWRLASPIVAATLFDFDALWTRAEPIAALGSGARGPALRDALAIAAVHLVAHHPRERGLLWLNDLARLASALTHDQRAELIHEARERRMTTVVATALGKAQARFPAAANHLLLTSLASDRSEPSAALLSTPSAAQRAMLDVRALATWKHRTTYLAGHLFPPAEYMRRRYAPHSRAPLAWLYAARLLRGAPRWLRPALQTWPFNVRGRVAPGEDCAEAYRPRLPRA